MALDQPFDDLSLAVMSTNGARLRPCLQVIQGSFERVTEDECPQDEKEVLMPNLKI